MYVEQAGAGDELVQKVLAGQSPRERAAQLVEGTRLKDVAVRRALAKGGKAATEASRDPMIELARLVDKPARTCARSWSSRSTNRCGKRMPALPRRGSPSSAPRSIPTRRSRSAVVRRRAGYTELGRKMRRGPPLAAPSSTPRPTTIAIRSNCRHGG